MIAKPASPILKLSGVAKVYGPPTNPLTVLDGIDLEIAEGEFAAIIGPSGAGKSTLLNILGCLDRPTRGSYLLRGENVACFDDRKLSLVRRKRIGFIFQSFQLIPHLNVLENVEMPMFYARIPRRRRHLECRKLIDRVGLGHRIDHLPRELSGGENQRAAIARALANQPSVLLADEPTGNLDSATSREILELLSQLHLSGTTIVLITHNPDLASAAPRRVTLRDGRIEGDTAPPATARRSDEEAKGAATENQGASDDVRD